MSVNLSFAGAATHGAFRSVDRENLSWRINHDATQSAREDSGEGMLFPTILSGPLIGTAIGEAIGAHAEPPESAGRELSKVGGPDPSHDVTPAPPEDHITSSNTWYLLCSRC